jgi:hypothetical protein
MTFKYKDVLVAGPYYKALHSKFRKYKGTVAETIEHRPFYGLKTSLEIATYGQPVDVWPLARDPLKRFHADLTKRQAAGRTNLTPRLKKGASDLMLPDYATRNIADLLYFISQITDDFETQKPLAYASGTFEPRDKGTLPANEATSQEAIIAYHAQINAYRTGKIFNKRK